MNAAKNKKGSCDKKLKKILFLTKIVTGYVACMALADLRQSLGTCGNISVVLGSVSF